MKKIKKKKERNIDNFDSNSNAVCYEKEKVFVRREFDLLNVHRKSLFYINA